MTFSINHNNVSATAQYNLVKNSTMLTDSIERLSSGLRVNDPSDDPAGSGIASKLEAHALGLGQAVRNANDGISMMQVADSTMSEAVDILQSIKTKAVEAAQDTQTSDSRSVLQNDIDKLLLEMDSLIKSSTYNDLQLLTGSFSNKRFQVGAFTGESLNVTLDSAEPKKIGHVRTGTLTVTDANGGDVSLEFTNFLTNETLSLQSINVSYNNSADSSMQALADAINSYSTDTGLSARAVVESTGSDPVQAGSTSAAFAINDVSIGAVTTLANDADNSLISAINNKTSSHGVTASITSEGYLNLVSSDGRPIEITGAETSLTASDNSSMSTFGYAQVYQKGPYQLSISDTSTGFAVAFSSNMEIAGDVTTTTDSTMAAGSVLGSASTLVAGWENGVTLSGGNLAADISTTATSTLLAGSVLASGSTIAAGSTLGGTGALDTSVTTTANSYLKSGTVLTSNSVVAAGTYLTNTIYSGGTSYASGQTLDTDRTLSGNHTLTSAMLLVTGSVLVSASTLTAGSYLGGDFVQSGAMSLSTDMTLLANSTLIDTDGETLFAVGSTVGGSATLDNTAVTMTQSMTIKAGSVLASTSSLANGSTIGGSSELEGDHTTTSDLRLAAGSTLASNSVIKSGTEFTNSINTTSGLVSSGTVSSQDYSTSGSNALGYAMTLKSGSVVSSGSTLAANASNSTSTTLSGESTLRLSDLSVLTMEDALNAIELADAALSDLNRFRSNVGAIQNQFSSSVNVMTETQINLEDAKSNILDVDFTQETRNFTKMNVLVQSGIFALTQANALTGSVLGLLQGGQDSSSLYM